MRIFGSFFGGGKDKLKEVIDNLNKELELTRAETKLNTELDTLIKKELRVFNNELVIKLSGRIKEMMNKKSIREKQEILKDIKKALLELSQKDKFNDLLDKIKQNYDMQLEKIIERSEELKLCPQP